MNRAGRLEKTAMPTREEARLQALEELQLLDTDTEERFDRVCRLGAALFGTPICYVSLMDADRQWFKAACGLPGISESPRANSFCTYVVEMGRTLTIADASLDERFRTNPYVTGPPHIRFYMGHPLSTNEGFVVGTYCVMDTEPRQVTGDYLAWLADLAGVAEREINLHSLVGSQRRILEATARIVGSVPHQEFLHDLLLGLQQEIEVEGLAVALVDDEGLRVSNAQGSLAFSLGTRGALTSRLKRATLPLSGLGNPVPGCFHRQGHTAWWVTIPIRSGDRLLGVLFAEQSGTTSISPLERDVLRVFAAQAALALVWS